MLAMAASASSVGSPGFKTSASESYAIGSKGNLALSSKSIPRLRIRLSFVGLCANWRQFVPPGPLLLELGCQPKQRGLIAEPRGKHHAEWQPGRIPGQRH